MKKIVVALVVAFSLVACKKEDASSKVKTENIEAAAQRDAKLQDGPKVTFDKEVYDFGVVNEGDLVKTSFIVTNSGKSDLVISNAKGSCGCTVPTWSKDPIKPGETSEIKIEFNTNGKPNKQTKTVTLTTNTEKGSETFKITGMVTPKGK